MSHRHSSFPSVVSNSFTPENLHALSSTPSLTHHASNYPLVPCTQPPQLYGPTVPIMAYTSRAGPDHYMVMFVDEDWKIKENILVQDWRWSGPLVVVDFVAHNSSQLVTRCIGRNKAGDAIERYLVVKKSDCVVPPESLLPNEVGDTLKMGLTEEEYMARDSPGVDLPLPCSPLPFPIPMITSAYLSQYSPTYLAYTPLPDAISSSSSSLPSYKSFLRSLCCF
jgi:hypothetical protein